VVLLVEKMDASEWLNLGIDLLQNAKYEEAEEAFEKAKEFLERGD